MKLEKDISEEELEEEENFAKEFSNVYRGNSLLDLSEEEKEKALKYQKRIDEKNILYEKRITFLENLLYEILLFEKKLDIKDFFNADKNSKNDQAYIDLYNKKIEKNFNTIKYLKQKLQKERLKNIRLLGKIYNLRTEISNLIIKSDITMYALSYAEEMMKSFEDKIKRLENALGESQLTKLPTERILRENLENIKKENRKNIKVGYMDLTDFKNVNTVLGYHNADRVLQCYGEALKEAIPKLSDENKKIIPYHPHGDEFAVTFENLTDEEIVQYSRDVERIAQEKIQTLKQALKKQRDENGNLVYVAENIDAMYTSISFGISNFLKKDTDETVLARINKYLDGVKNFKKGDILIGNTIYSGAINEENYRKEKTNEEINILIEQAKQQLKRKEEVARKKREKGTQDVLECKIKWKKDYSVFQNLPSSIKESLEKNIISSNFSQELQNLQLENSNKTEKEKIETAELYLSTAKEKKLTVSQKKILPIVFNMNANSSREFLVKKYVLKEVGFTQKEIKILLRSGLLGVQKMDK